MRQKAHVGFLLTSPGKYGGLSDICMESAAAWAALLHMLLPNLSSEARYNGWVRDHYRFIFRSAWALTGSRSVAEDVVQDCYTLAWKHRAQLRDQALARAWLFRIMRRCALRHIAPGPISYVGDDELGHDRVGDDSRLDDRLDVVKALAVIAPIHREVLVLYYFDDMPTGQMAEALEIAPGTVLSRLSRAREALKAAMAPAPRNDGGKVTPLRKTSNA